MSLIDISYFIGLLDIPNKKEPEISGNVTYYINRYEPEFLQKFFGYPLYKAYMENSTDQRFVDIIEGKEFTNLNTGQIEKWNGLIIEVVPPVMNGTDIVTPAISKSLIANYIYFHFRRENASFFTGTSENTNEGETTPVRSLRARLALVWNEINNAIETFTAFMDANQTVYPEWTWTDRITALRYFGYMNPIF